MLVRSALRKTLRMTEYLLSITFQESRSTGKCEAYPVGRDTAYFAGTFQSVAVTPSLVMNALTW
jgi:hypothetical protein